MRTETETEAPALADSLMTLEDYDLINGTLVYFSGIGWKIRNPLNPECTAVSPAGTEFKAVDFYESSLDIPRDNNPERNAAEAFCDLLYADAAYFKGVCTRRLFTPRT